MGQGIQNRAAPAQGVVAITKADADLTIWIRSLYVGTAGDVKVTAVNGTTAVIPSVPAGSTIPCEIKRVWSTGTTASGFVGYY